MKIDAKENGFHEQADVTDGSLTGQPYCVDRPRDAGVVIPGSSFREPMPCPSQVVRPLCTECPRQKHVIASRLDSTRELWIGRTVRLTHTCSHCMRERDVQKATSEPGTKREGVQFVLVFPRIPGWSAQVRPVWSPPNDTAKYGRTPDLGLTDWARQGVRTAGPPVCPEACLQTFAPLGATFIVQLRGSGQASRQVGCWHGP